MTTATEPGSAPERPRLRQSVTGLPDPGERVPGLAWPTAALYVGTLALFAVEMLSLFAWDVSRWLTVPMGAAVTFLMFSVLHEATHHAISTHTRLNDAFGHAAVPFVVPWSTFSLVKYLHIEHHRNTNEPKSIDPDAWADGPLWQLPFRWATIDLWYLVFYVRRMPDRPRGEVTRVLAVFVGVLAAFSVIVATGHGAALLWGLLVPQRIGLVVLAWWFDYLPHHGLTTTQREDKYQATRIRVGGEKVLTPLFLYQNYHLVHHLHPSVPFYRYVRAWRRNEEAYLDRNAAISTWFGRSLTPSEYRTWRRLTDELDGGSSMRRPVFHPLRVRSVEPVTSDSVAVTFDVPADLADAYRYVQGQHLTLRAVVDGREVRRSYSVIEPVSARTLRVAVKRIDGGTFSSYVNDELAADDILDVMTPTGGFHVPLLPDAARHHVGVVAGSGITPLMSTIATTLETEPHSRFTLIYGSRTTESTMFAERLAAWQRTYGDRLEVHHVLSREDGAPLGGRIDPDLVARLVPDTADVAAWFLCGPQEMVTDLKIALGEVTDPGCIATEVFHVEPASNAGVGVDVTSEVTVALDGVETTFSLASGGDSILDAALQAGIDAPYSCAGGACGTCRARVLIGSTTMDQNHVLEEAEVADGYVLTCQAHPTTDAVHVDYNS